MNRAGVEMVEPARFGGDATVIFGLPVSFPFGTGQPAHPRRDLIYHTMIECSPMPPGWADILNLCRAVWAPSQWVAQEFRAGGVKAPIMVSGYGVDHRMMTPGDRWLASEQKRFRVGVWADGFGSRKNVLQSLQVFLSAGFPDNEAELEIKVNTRPQITPEQVAVTDRPNVRVRIHNGSWSRPNLVNWLRSLDVMLYLSGGEGYGLMPLEAMACGCPVIVPIHTGMKEYLTPGNCLPVEIAGKTEAPTYEHLFGYKAWMLAPDLDSAIEQLRWAYDHRSDLETLGRVAACSAHELTWDAAGEQAVAALQAALVASAN
jgi:glycosyltransferase involved in cell wall biosynthesis